MSQETLERLAEQPTPEKYKHFDILASIDLMRFDLATQGHIHPETERRVYDEELSYVAEGIDRPMETIFALKQIGGELMYFSEGSWQPYQAMLTKGIRSAQLEAAADPRKSFLVDMATSDYLIGQQWKTLEPGQKMNWYSPFRDRELQLYGTKFMNELGFQSARRMGFIYEAEKDQLGNVILKTRSVDNSDEKAFEAAMLAAQIGKDPVAAYDGYLTSKNGQKYTAGRLKDNEQDAWAIIHKNRDLVEYYMDNLKSLARNFYVGRDDLEKDKKRLTYGFWAAIKERMEHGQYGVLGGYKGHIPSMALAEEINIAYSKLMAKGEVMFGCGGSIGPEENLMTADAGDVFSSIFGNSNHDKYGSMTFKCPKGHTNTRPRNKLIPRCTTCHTSVMC